MANASDYKVGRTSQGRWAATSISAPYFYFEGDNREEVVHIAKRARQFYAGADGGSKTQEMDHKPTLTRVKLRETISDDCVAA